MLDSESRFFELPPGSSNGLFGPLPGDHGARQFWPHPGEFWLELPQLPLMGFGNCYGFMCFDRLFVLILERSVLVSWCKIPSLFTQFEADLMESLVDLSLGCCFH